uniref:C2H2-type domain-containing protein n=1 Tax=Rhabditophanes sp. KR3021 TaxID=114890 RepID=A0AC35UGP9_9BILA
MHMNASPNTSDSTIKKGGTWKCGSCKATFNYHVQFAYHCKGRVCSKLRAEVKKIFEEDKQLDPEQLLDKLKESLKKAASRRTCKGKQSFYVLLDLPKGIDVKLLTFKQFMGAIFYCGVSGALQTRFNKHGTATQRFFSRFIPLNAKETKIMNILHGKRQLVAMHLDSLSSNEALAYEYAVILDLQDTITNIDASGQSNGVMFLKHPTTVKRISRIVLDKIGLSQKYII